MGTVIVGIILLTAVIIVIRSIIKSRKTGQHPSCGGNCGSCGHACSELYPHMNSLIEEQKSKKLKS